MQRPRNQSKIYRFKTLHLSICRHEASKVKYRTEILLMAISRDKESKVKSTELKYWRY